MKYYRKYTNAFRVTVDKTEMQRILHKWPSQGDRAWFEFDPTTGEFIEHRVIRNHTGRANSKRDCNERPGWSDDALSEVAIIALRYGMKRQTKYLKRIMNSPISILKLPKKAELWPEAPFAGLRFFGQNERDLKKRRGVANAVMLHLSQRALNQSKS
jgi:hypothetical protein